MSEIFNGDMEDGNSQIVKASFLETEGEHCSVKFSTSTITKANNIYKEREYEKTKE